MKEYLFEEIKCLELPQVSVDMESGKVIANIKTKQEIDIDDAIIIDILGVDVKLLIISRSREDNIYEYMLEGEIK